MNWNQNDKGMTMVEVIVSFVLLLMALGFLSQAVFVAGNIQKRIFRERTELSEINRSYYLDQDPETSRTTVLEFTTDQGETVFFPVIVRSFQDGIATLYDVKSDSKGSGS